MDDDLRMAFGPVFTDLASHGVAAPRLEESNYRIDDEVMSPAMVRWANGSGMGVHISRAAIGAEQIADLADQIQDGAVEELCRLGQPAVWPDCPDHPDSHPLTARVLDDTPVWACPRNHRTVSRIGDLPPRNPAVRMSS